MSTTKLAILISSVVILMALSAYGGYRFGNNSTAIKQAVQPSKTQSDAPLDLLRPAIKQQRVIAEGKIIKANQDTITIQGDKTGEVALKLHYAITIYPQASASGMPVRASNNKADILPGQKALITLDFEGNEYLVKTISYLPAK